MAALDNINRYIKELTGAQMSEAEAKRLRQGLPDPGDDPFSGDSPSGFRKKMKDKNEMMKLAMIRYTYLRSGKWHGGVFKGNRNDIPIGLSQMKNMLKSKRKMFINQARDLPPQQRSQFIDQKMNQEFGI